MVTATNLCLLLLLVPLASSESILATFFGRSPNKNTSVNKTVISNRRTLGDIVQIDTATTTRTENDEHIDQQYVSVTQDLLREKPEANYQPRPNIRPVAYYQPGANYQSGANYQPGAIYQPGSYSQPGSNYQPGSYYQPGANYQPEANYQSGSYYQPGANYQSGSYYQPGANYQPRPYYQPRPNYQPGANYQLRANYQPESYYQPERNYQPGQYDQSRQSGPYGQYQYPQYGQFDNLGRYGSYEQSGHVAPNSQLGSFYNRHGQNPNYKQNKVIQENPKYERNSQFAASTQRIPSADQINEYVANGQSGTIHQNHAQYPKNGENKPNAPLGANDKDGKKDQYDNIKYTNTSTEPALEKDKE